MTFRDDREAAHQRVASLEKELDQKQSEIDRLRGKRQGVRIRRSPLGALLAVATLVVLGSGAAFLAMAAKAQRNVSGQRDTLDAERRAHELAIARLRAERARSVADRAIANLEQGAVAIGWSGSVDRSEGLTLARGTPCSLDAIYSSPLGTEEQLVSLTIQCGGRILYRSTDRAEGDHVPPRKELREGPASNGTALEYMLNWDDPAVGSTTRPSAHVSTLEHQADVASTGPEAYHVVIFVNDVSRPREGEPLLNTRPLQTLTFSGASSWNARATTVHGPAPVRAGAQCTVSVRPVWEQAQNCRMAVRCDGQWVYGAGETGYLICQVTGGRAVAASDDNPRPQAGDPRLNWQGTRVTVSDLTQSGVWDVVLENR